MSSRSRLLIGNELPTIKRTNRAVPGPLFDVVRSHRIYPTGAAAQSCNRTRRTGLTSVLGGFQSLGKLITRWNQSNMTEQSSAPTKRGGQGETPCN
jgi:hypothetical protein